MKAICLPTPRICLRSSLPWALVALLGLFGPRVSSFGACVPSAPGLVSWWTFDLNGNDEMGANPGTVDGGAPFVAGKVLGAVSLDGVDDDVRVPAGSTLDVGTGQGMTIEGWFKPQDPFAQRPLIEWNDGHGNVGVHLWVSQSGN